MFARLQVSEYNFFLLSIKANLANIPGKQRNETTSRSVFFMMAGNEKLFKGKLGWIWKWERVHRLVHKVVKVLKIKLGDDQIKEESITEKRLTRKLIIEITFTYCLRFSSELHVK